MRRLRYHVAASLDGYIAGPNGEYDWIPRDPDIDFKALFSEFDTALIGRRTYDLMVAAGMGMMQGMEIYVFSRTLNARDYPKVNIVSKDSERVVADLKRQGGKDIWLFGGGELFRSLAEAKLVDTVEPAVVPVLLGGGIPLLPTPAPRITLTFESERLYKQSGIVWLSYAIRQTADG